MRIKTIKTLFITLLMCLGSVGNAQIIQVLASENYENLEVTDWTCPNGLATLNTDDATYGNYAYLEAQGSGNRSAYKSVVLGDVNEVYIDKYLTTEGYNVEFDAYLRAGQQKDRSASQFIIPTTGPNVTKDNDLYGGTDYVFALSQPTNTTGEPSKEWYINDLTNTVGEVVNLEHAWYHFLITVTKSKVSYEITSGENTIASGAMTTNYETLPTIKGFWTLLGRTYGSVRFDNLEIYCYKMDPSRISVLYERGTTTAWSENDLTEWTASNAGPTSYINNGLVVKVDGSGTSGNYSKIISPTSKISTLTLRAIWNPGGATGTANNTNAYLSFGDVKFAFYGSSWFTKVTIGDTTTQLSGAGATRNRDYSIEVKINQMTNEVTYSFTDNGTTVTGTGVTGSSGSFTKLTHGLGGKVPKWYNETTLKNIEIIETTPMFANYVINYQRKDGTLIKSDTIESFTGELIEITEEQKATFFNDDKTIKYYYAEDDSEGKTVMGDGSTVVTIIVDEAVVATTIHDFEDENTIFTGRSRISIACEYNEEQGSNVCKFTNAGNAQNGYCFANYNIESLTKYANKVIINFDYKPGGRSYVTIGDASIRGNTGGSSKSTYSNIGAIFRVGMNKDNAQVNSINLDRNKFEGNWLNVNVEIDTLSKKVSYIIKQKSDGTILTEGTEVDYYNASAAKCTQVDFFDYINNAVSYIDNIIITTESVYVIQQLNYQTEEGTILKSDNVKSFGVIKGLPLVIKYEDSYYTLDDDRLSDYSLDVRSNHLDETVTVNYRHSPDVVFFREGESSQGTDARYSSGGSGTVAAQNKRDRGISVGTLPVGEYEFIVNIPTEETNKRSLVIRQSQNDPLASVGLSNADMTTGIKTAIFKLTEETSSLFINGANSGTEKTNLSVLFDYVMVKIKSVPLTLTSAGVSTLCSPYNLDFTDAQNVAAYKAEIDEENGKIRLEKVTTVAAREGVLIRSLSGEAVTEDVPASASAFEVNEGNDFIGTLVNINNQASEDEEYRYYILGGKKNAEGNMVYGFYLAGGKNIGAGKAYLKVPKSAAAKFSFFALEDETTGIEDIHAVQHDDTKVYDLSGRRVVKPSKGLYIKNGKKFIVK